MFCIVEPAVGGTLLLGPVVHTVYGRGDSACFTEMFCIVEPTVGGTPLLGPVVHAVYGRGGSRGISGGEDGFRAGGDDPHHRGNQQPHVLYDKRGHTVPHTGW